MINFTEQLIVAKTADIGLLGIHTVGDSNSLSILKSPLPMRRLCQCRIYTLVFIERPSLHRW